MVQSEQELPETARRELERYFSSHDESFELKSGDHVVVCTHSLHPGGAERQWIYLAQGLDAAGYRVTFVTFSSLLGPGGHYLPLLKRSGIRLFDTSTLDKFNVARNSPRVPHLESVLAATGIPLIDHLRRLTTAFNSLKPRAVFAQLDDGNLLCGVSARLSNVPRVVLSFRNYNPSRLGWFFEEWYLPCYTLLATSAAVRFTGNSQDANNDYADWIGIPRKRILHIPNVVDSEWFCLPNPSEVAELRARLGIASNQPVVLGVFRLHPEKDPETFLHVVRHIINEVPNLKVLLAGVGPMKSQLESKIIEQGIEHNFQFLGLRSDINVLMALADIVLLTSRMEGMPNVLLEAQLMETPVVATCTRGAAQVVRNSITSILCPIGDVQSLANACIRLLRDKSRAREMGAAGRCYVLENFPKAVLAERYIKALE